MSSKRASKDATKSKISEVREDEYFIKQDFCFGEDCVAKNGVILEASELLEDILYLQSQRKLDRAMECIDYLVEMSGTIDPWKTCVNGAEKAKKEIGEMK